MEQTPMGIKGRNIVRNWNGIIISVLVLVLINGCTIFPPGNNLYEGLEEEIKIEELTENVHIVGFWKTQVECLGEVGFMGILGFPVLGCALLYYNANGEGYWCDIYMIADWDWMYEHEHRHCLGYSDF